MRSTRLLHHSIFFVSIAFIASCSHNTLKFYDEKSVLASQVVTVSTKSIKWVTVDEHEAGDAQQFLLGPGHHVLKIGPGDKNSNSQLGSTYDETVQNLKSKGISYAEGQPYIVTLDFDAEEGRSYILEGRVFRVTESSQETTGGVSFYGASTRPKTLAWITKQ